MLIILWLLGVPIVVIVLLYLIARVEREGEMPCLRRLYWRPF